MKNKLYIGAILTVVLIASISTFFYMKKSSSSPTQTTQTASPRPMNTETHITFNTKEYHQGFTLPGGGDDFTSESYEWVTGTETVENWTTLLTTHKLISKNPTVPLSAEAYAQNVASMLTNQGAFMLETSIINQDMEAMGLDPAHPPYLLAYLFNSDGMTEFDMQKIVQQADGSIVSIIYAERFPTKTEADMKAYYESKERTDKRIELIKTKLPY